MSVERALNMWKKTLTAAGVGTRRTTGEHETARLAVKFAWISYHLSSVFLVVEPSKIIFLV